MRSVDDARALGDGEGAAVSALLKQWREAHGYSRRRLADELGVSEGSIKNWEAGGKITRGNLLMLRHFMTSQMPSPPSEGSEPPPNGQFRDDTLSASPDPHLPSATADHLFVVERPEGVSVEDWRRITADERERIEWLLGMARRARGAYEAVTPRQTATGDDRSRD
jgi:transcriptional regulator with XRE-family HTH domain